MIDNTTLPVAEPALAGPGVGTVSGAEPPVTAEPSGSSLTLRDRRGMVSAEWAVGIIAAIAIAGVLLAVVTSGPVQEALLRFILQVIHSFSGFLTR